MRRRTPVALAGAVLLAVVAVAAYLVLDAQRTPDVDCSSFRFDSVQFKRWQADPDTGPYGPPHEAGSRFTTTQVAAHGLVKCGTLAGSDKREVRALIGLPDGNAVGDDSWSYAVGPGQGLFGKVASAEESLVVRFDREGAVVEAEVRTRRT